MYNKKELNLKKFKIKKIINISVKAKKQVLKGPEQKSRNKKISKEGDIKTSNKLSFCIEKQKIKCYNKEERNGTINTEK